MKTEKQKKKRHLARRSKSKSLIKNNPHITAHKFCVDEVRKYVLFDERHHRYLVGHASLNDENSAKGRVCSYECSSDKRKAAKKWSVADLNWVMHDLRRTGAWRPIRVR